jgi:hypothetical protein
MPSLARRSAPGRNGAKWCALRGDPDTSGPPRTSPPWPTPPKPPRESPAARGSGAGASGTRSYPLLLNHPIGWNLRRAGAVACGCCISHRGEAIGYLRNDGSGRKLLSPRRSRLCSRRIPSLRGRHTDAPGKRSAPLQHRRDSRWMGARGVR